MPMPSDDEPGKRPSSLRPGVSNVAHHDAYIGDGTGCDATEEGLGGVRCRCCFGLAIEKGRLHRLGMLGRAMTTLRYAYTLPYDNRIASLNDFDETRGILMPWSAVAANGQHRPSTAGRRALYRRSRRWTQLRGCLDTTAKLTEMAMCITSEPARPPSEQQAQQLQ
ncbi:hypothetical protein GGTG_08634 [Gaeumannomyces tritici R3-111a-1]|uniref:Uncharacterized protein n=1 Tax=Gaeumannomyces tritici (strain R3-111a-1) TaxID=644352 RepID=J3P548_GAET3|nr:hypothetical protein GGTG_08634 [Gaeumannomyces tritici R3-111a-1]EJT74796.1 hypothetical protein GGTG_08634 [Gaeumannomyces tritici R3-111a-1]